VIRRRGFRHYFPSFTGDIRAEAHPEDSAATLLTVENPTAEEQKRLEFFMAAAPRSPEPSRRPP
jgi:hypothetical protein